jgi:hypothetical protein
MLSTVHATVSNILVGEDSVLVPELPFATTLLWYTSFITCLTIQPLHRLEVYIVCDTYNLQWIQRLLLNAIPSGLPCIIRVCATTIEFQVLIPVVGSIFQIEGGGGGGGGGGGEGFDLFNQ